MKRHISIFAFLLGAVFAVGSVADLRADESVRACFVSTGDSWNGSDTTHITPSLGNLLLNKKDQPLVFTALPPPGYQVTRWLWNDSFSLYLKESDMSEITGSVQTRWVSDDLLTCTLLYSGDGQRALGVRFDAMPLTVTFDKNGGSGSMSPVEEKDYDSVFDLPANAFTKTGHSFANWTNAVGKVFTDGQSVKGSDFWNPAITNFSADLVAVWTANVYTVSLDPQDGSGTIGSVIATYGEKLPTIVPPELPGWEFTGYFTDKDGGGEQYYAADGTGKKEWDRTEDLTLYADWSVKSYWLAYHTECEVPDPAKSKHNVTDKVDLLSAADVRRPGYSLLAWERRTPTFTTYAPGTSVANLSTGEDVDLHARWEPISYRVEFNSNGGEGTMDPLTPKYGESFKVPACEFSKTGCEFRFWSAEIGGIATNFEAGAVVSNLTTEAGVTIAFKAEWTGHYTVAFDANGGKGTMTNLAYETGVEYALPSNAFTKTGYRFYGWATNRDDAVALKKPAYTNGQTVVDLAAPGETRTLFAEWTTNRYTVVFNPNGDGVKETMEPQDFFYDQVKPLSPNRFTRGELWSFAGWSNSVGRVFENGESVSNLCADDGGIVDLFARWVSERGPLSEAMGCDNLKWEPEKDLAEEQPLWKVCDSEGSDGPPCVQQINGYWARMYAHITTNGTLTFKVKLTTANDKLVVNVGQLPDLDPIVGETLTFSYQEGAEWQDAVVEVPKLIWDSAYVRIYHWNDWESGTAFVDQMTWTPKGSEPTPGEPVAATAAGVEDGVFSLTIPTASGIEYGVWTNADLTVPAESWGLMETKKAAGETLDFSFEIVPGLPQLFFRAYEIK